jgi:hypothetical protein
MTIWPGTPEHSMYFRKLFIIVFHSLGKINATIFSDRKLVYLFKFLG